MSLCYSVWFGICLIFLSFHSAYSYGVIWFGILCLIVALNTGLNRFIHYTCIGGLISSFNVFITNQISVYSASTYSHGIITVYKTNDSLWS